MNNQKREKTGSIVLIPDMNIIIIIIIVIIIVVRYDLIDEGTPTVEFCTDK